MIKIKHIVLEHEAFPIRWWLMDENGNEYTIRERGGECVIHKGIKSIFEVTQEDVILEFEVKEHSDESTLPIALEKMGAVLLPGAEDDDVNAHFEKHNPWNDYKKKS